MAESKIVKPIGDLNLPFKQAVDGTLHTFDPAICPASGTTTADGNVGGTTLIDDARTEATNHWNGQLILITSGARNGQVREIVTWDLPTFTFTVNPAFGGQILTGVTYKVLSALAADIDIAALQADVGDASASTLGSIYAILGNPAQTFLAMIGYEGATSIADKLTLARAQRLDAAISSRAIPGDAMALTPAERLVIQALILNDVTPFSGADVGTILVDTADIQPRVPRILCSIDFWGDIIEELQLTSALQANLALAGADVVIAGLPDDITIVRVVVMFMCRAIENTQDTQPNNLQGAQNIEVNFGGGAFIDAIALADNLFNLAAATRENGPAIAGKIDVKATVTGNGTCTFRIDAARADFNNLNFNDYQVGVRVYYTV